MEISFKKKAKCTKSKSHWPFYIHRIIIMLAKM